MWGGGGTPVISSTTGRGWASLIYVAGKHISPTASIHTYHSIINISSTLATPHCQFGTYLSKQCSWLLTAKPFCLPCMQSQHMMVKANTLLQWNNHSCDCQAISAMPYMLFFIGIHKFADKKGQLCINIFKICHFMQ